MQYIHRSRDGFALAIVLWIVAALLAGVAYFTLFSKEELQTTQQLDNKLEANLQAQSTLASLKYYIMTADYDGRSVFNTLDVKNFSLPHRIILDGREYNLSKNISISLQDTSALIDVFYPDPVLLAKMATDQNDRQLFYTLRDSIKDWRDEDNIVSLNGAEESYYRLKKNLLYGPRNSPAVQSVDEIRIIKGFADLSKQKWNDVKKYLYYGYGATVNLALIDDRYLSKLLGLNFLEARTLKTLRTKDLDKFIQEIQKLKTYNDEYMGFYLSFNIFLKIKVQVGDTVSKISTIIKFKNTVQNKAVVENYSAF